MFVLGFGMRRHTKVEDDYRCIWILVLHWDLALDLHLDSWSTNHLDHILQR